MVITFQKFCPCFQIAISQEEFRTWIGSLEQYPLKLPIQRAAPDQIPRQNTESV